MTGNTPLSLSPNSLAASDQNFVPPDFKVPAGIEADRFRLRMLTIQDVDKDFEAVVSSVASLQRVWNSDWPAGLTLEQNLIDLGWHQKEFQRRTSFAYTVVSPDESQVLGCVYIYPTRKPGFDAEAYFWVRDSESSSGLESRLEREISDWLKGQWPFRAVAFPGRTISWEHWQKL